MSKARSLEDAEDLLAEVGQYQPVGIDHERAAAVMFIRQQKSGFGRLLWMQL